MTRFRNDGAIEFLGRIDHQVKLRGFRIELGEIETALAGHSAVENTVVMAREDREGDKRLVAYIVASTEGLEGEELEQWGSEQVGQWQDLWQDAYSQSGEVEDLAYDFRGWNSSYTGGAIPEEEMHAWLRDTCERILELEPRRVLEIGSGSGLVAAQIAPACADYTATDFSHASIATLEKLRDSHQELGKLQLNKGAADEVATLGKGDYDTIILNSVAQYFPDIDYLRNFLQQAVTRLPNGGHIFLGDLRSTLLLEAYHTSVQLFQAEDDLPLRELAENIRQRTEQEEELLIDPAFFIALQKEMPAISGVRFEIKRSRFRNELTRFRYDVVLAVNTDPEVRPEPQHLDWNTAGLQLATLSERLADIDNAGLLITGIPDARLAAEKYALEKLEFAEEGTVGELRIADTAGTVEPEDLYGLAEQYTLDVQISGALPGEISALFRPAGISFDGPLMHAPRPVPWRDYGNDPLQGRLQRSLVPILCERLLEEVPEYMVPSAFVILDAFPLTPNGKINRKALPAPERKRREQEIYVAPRTETEEQLVTIWSDVLGVKQIGMHDDFFALGGHSLLATQLISRIRDSLNTELPLLALFNHPTVAGLAVEITGDEAAVASAVIQRGERGDAIPLSFAQQRLWFLDQLEGVSSTYNVPLALALEGTLNIDALQATVDKLVARHESLRTGFATTQGVAVQLISDSLHVPVDVVDLKDASKTEVQARLEELAQTPFDLSRDALLRVHVLQSGQNRQVLLLVMHHIVSDGWSLGILARELAALYAEHCGAIAAELADLPIQYADFAIWQRGWLAGEELRRQLGYWEEQLDDAPGLLQLPTDRPRQSVQTFNGAHINLTLSHELGDAIRELAGAEDVTLFMTLLAAFNTLLARYTGTDDIVVGTPIAGRNRTEIEGLVGFFVNTLAMRTDMSGDPDFIEVLRRVKKTALGAYAHQEIPFEKLVEELQPDRDTSHPPLFQVLFVLQENLSDQIGFHELEVTPLDFELGSSKFDLSLFMVEFPEGLTASIEYNTDLFESTTIERLLQHFETLLRAIIADPARPITQLRLLTTAEREHVLADFNATQSVMQPISVHGLVELQAERTPDACALHLGEESLSYTELNARANRLALHLGNIGAVPGTLVGICAGRSIDTAVSVLAVLKSGAAYVPIDPNYPADRVQYMLDDSQAPVLLTESGLAGQLPEHKAATVFIDQFDWASGDAANPGDLGGESVYAIYTSGSTGKPKGVELTHAGLSNLVQWQSAQPGLDTPARTLQFASLSFDVSFQELFTTWAQGGTVVLVDEELRRDLSSLARFIATDGIERVYLPFAALQPLAECVTGDSGLEFVVRDVIVAGEQLQITPTIRAMFEVLGNARLHNHYGPSEAHVVTAYTLGEGINKWMPLPPIGKPVANTQAYILDANLEPVPVGVPGELYLGGVQVGRGYIHRKALTAEKFLPDPFVENAAAKKLARMYRTGDRVRYLSDGNIEYLGRTDDQVKWRGFRIEPGEIEATLNEHQNVQQAAVMLREDQPGDKRLIAYLVAAEDEAIDTVAVRDWLREQVPDYMVPSAFVSLDSMPLTPSGKVARRKLPVPDYADSAQIYVAPRTPVEEALVQIWSDVLDVSQVGIHDDFFELGGHSLLATQLLSRVRNALDVELPLVALFNHPSVAGLATDIAQASGATPLEAIKACDRSQPLPLSFAQQRLWFLDQLEPGNPVYNLPWAMQLDGPLNMQAFQAAIDDLVSRHEMLRTLFSVTMGKPQQCVLDKVSVSVESVDATGDDEAAIEARLRTLSRIPFGLGQTPLMRVHVLHVGNRKNIVLLVLHHIVSDGWSLSVLYQELVRLYAGHCLGETVKLPALPVQYADYSVWQHDWFRSSEQKRQLDYWTQRLGDAPAILDLPTDRPRGSVQTYNGSFIEYVLPKAIHSGLKDVARQENSTLFMVCLAAFNILMARYSGQKDICIGTPVAGRRHTELEGLIGFFINTLVMRNDLEGAPDFAEFLARVKNTALEAYSHQEFPFEKLVDEIQPVRDMSHAPLFQVAFIFQNTPWDQGATLHDIDLSPIELDYGVAKFDLSLVMAERREGLLVHFEYNTDLYDKRTIDKMLGHFETLLLAIVSDPRMPVAELPLLTAPERKQVLFDWNETQVPFSDNTCIHTLIEQRAAEQPDAPAILFRDEVISFDELNQRANQVAHYLIGHGAGPEKIVGLCVERSVNLVTGLLGILKAGAAYVPLDPNYPGERLEWMLEDTQAPLVITQTALLDQLPHTNAKTICLDLDWHEIASHADGNPERQADPEDLAYVIYTSGSTGKPKGVMIRHKGVCNLADAQARAFGLGPKDRMLQFASISFDASIFEIVMGLQVGAAMVLAPQDELLPGKPLLQTLDDKKVTAVTLPPTALSQLPAAELPLLKTVTVAGEACPPELVEQWGVNRRFFNLYGPTESTVWASFARCKPGDTVTIGKPITNTRLYVLDENLQPVPVGVAGELCIGGEGLARGYLNRKELSAEKFHVDPFRDEADARIYRTGDRVRFLPDGNIDFLGRIDHQVKVRGFRIELGEIETTLSARGDVREAVVIARGDSLQNKQLVAYIIPQGGSQLSLGELRAHLKESLPEFMIPAAFVVLKEFPLTPNGKVDRDALPEPDDKRLALEVEYVAPRDHAERVLAKIWKDLLNVEQVGIHDNFFELGGDSILSIQIIARASQEDLRLTPKQLFEHQTISELAATAGTGGIISADQGIVTGSLPLTPIQSWFAERALAEPQHFNQSQLFECESELDGELLEQAFQALLMHHDALRMTVTQESGNRVLQQMPDSAGEVLRTVSIEALDEQQQAEHMLRLSNALQANFDLANGPLVKALLIRREPGVPDRLLIVVHHVAIDWVSWNILLEDLQTTYQHLLAGQAVELPAKTTSYKAWSERLQTYADTDAATGEAGYWVNLPWANVKALPQDDPTGANVESSTRDATVWLSQDETSQLLQDVPRLWRTQINDVLLTALTRAVKQWSGSSTIAVNLEGHGREDLFDDINLSRTVGWFTTLYPQLLTLDTGNPGENLKAIRQQLQDVPNKGIGYGILRYLGPSQIRNELGAAPVPEIGFNYLGQLDQVAGTSGPLQPCFDTRGTELGPADERPHLVDFAIAVTGGRLQLSVLYSENRHRAETIEKLACRLLDELRGLISHCLSTTAMAWTPADFPLAQLTQPELDRLLADDPAVDDLCGVTSLQHGMLFHSLFTGEHDVYFARFRWRLEGAINVTAFERAWQQVIDRHTSLRASFHWEGLGEPVQIVHHDVKAHIETEDWEKDSTDDHEQKLNAFLAADQARRFDFTAPPLMRLALIRLNAEDHHFIWSFHHAIIDGWSVPLVLKEVFAVYDAERNERTIELAPPRPFSDYIAWLGSQDTAGAESFWRGLLTGFSAPTALPGARVQQLSLTSTPEYEEMLTRVPAKTVASLRRLAQESRLTLNTVIQGVWALLLSRYSGENDIVFGATTSGRPATMPGVGSMIGLFLNTLPVRARIEPQVRLLDWLQELQAVQLDVRNFEFASLVEVQGWSDVPRGTPMFGSLLAFENYPDMETMWTDTESITIREVDGFDRTNFPLTLNVAVFDELQLRVVFDTRMFDTIGMQKLCGHFEALLEGITAKPNQYLRDLSLLTSTEREELALWNQTGQEYPRADAMHTAFEQQSADKPDAIAVECAGVTLTYAELDRRANQLAHRLLELGAGKDIPVGLCIDRSADMLVALLGILKSGSAYLPLDPNFPPDRLRYMLEDSGAPLLVCTRDKSELADGLPVTRVCLDDADNGIGAQPATAPGVDIQSKQLAYVIYTSGSTGKPKGVTIEHQNAVNFLHSMARTPGICSEDRLLAVTTLSFDISILEIFTPLSVGGTVVVATADALADGFALARLLSDARITVMQATPATWRLLLEANWKRTESIKVLCGGEALDLELALRLAIPGFPVWNMYGPTETTIWSSCEAIEHDAERVSVGRPINNTTMYVLDEEGRQVPVGVAGELFIGGEGVARGYHERPELTAERFLPDPYSDQPGTRMYRTGDLARYLPDGRLIVLGRTDFQVKLRGYRIELGEIEAELAELDAITQAVVMLREDTPGDQRLVGYMTTVEGYEPDTQELSTYLRNSLPDYMVPATYVRLEQIPLTPNGKVDRKQLPAPEWSADQEYVAPRNGVEEELAVIWADILSVEQVGIHDDFFALGGHSLIAMKLVSRVLESMRVELPLDRVFESPTIAGLANSVSESRDKGEEVPEITRIERSSRRTQRRDKD
ncbi:MAG: amino acid adenylation domain-containing protein [Gammaproteobacteria bacterium]|nr:amino acid adenylation domain-containing protein [Gammaproteobacteria bacterium]